MALVFKVFTLTIRTAAKPFANRVSEYVLNHPTLAPPVFAMAQQFHRLDVWANASAATEGGKRSFLGRLTEEKAAELAGRIVSEGFVYSVAIGVIFLEYQRQRRTEKAKVAKEAAAEAAKEQHARDLVEGRCSTLDKECAQRVESLQHDFTLRLQVLQDAVDELRRQQRQHSGSHWGWPGSPAVPQDGP